MIMKGEYGMRIDFHSHILPEMDDGARNTAMSEIMLKSEKQQGIIFTALTSHYFKSAETPEEYLARRQESYGKLMTVYNKDTMPRLMLGAEIEMYRGMSDGDLSPLCLGDTNILLCEMPPYPEDFTAEELSELVCQGFVPMIAHFERYFSTYKERDLRDILSVEGCILQINIYSMANKRIREKVFRIAEEGFDFVLGTDAHNLSSRSVYIDRSALSGRPAKKFLSSVEKTERLLLEILKKQ